MNESSYFKANYLIAKKSSSVLDHYTTKRPTKHKRQNHISMGEDLKTMQKDNM